MTALAYASHQVDPNLWEYEGPDDVDGPGHEAAGEHWMLAVAGRDGTWPKLEAAMQDLEAADTKAERADMPTADQGGLQWSE